MRNAYKCSHTPKIFCEEKLYYIFPGVPEKFVHRCTEIKENAAFSI